MRTTISTGDQGSVRLPSGAALLRAVLRMAALSLSSGLCHMVPISPIDSVLKDAKKARPRLWACLWSRPSYI